MRKLTREEFKYTETLEKINEKKNYIQNLIIKDFFNIKKGILTAYTGMGKSTVFYKIINLFNKQKSEYTILIVVPKIILKDQIEEKVLEYGFKNVTVSVVNSLATFAVKNNNLVEYDLVICDEIHNLCGESSVYFSEIIPKLKYKYFFGCSATLESSHIKYLKSNNLEIFFDIPVQDGYKCGLVPDYNIYNVPVELNEKEQLIYYNIQKEYNSLVNIFTRHDPINPTAAISACLAKKDVKVKYEGIVDYSINHAKRIGNSINKTEGQTIGLAMLWRKVQTQRKMFLNKSSASIIMVETLLSKIDDQVMVFCASIEIADYLHNKTPNSGVYHSKISVKKKNQFKEDFLNNKIKVLFVCNSMKEGADFPFLKWIIRQGFNSTGLDVTQIIGRMLRFDSSNPDKESTLIHIYVEDFKINNVLQVSQQKKWLINSLWKKPFVTWTKSINEIKL